MFLIVQIREHFEVYDRFGRFLLSADNYTEALCEAEQLLAA